MNDFLPNPVLGAITRSFNEPGVVIESSPKVERDVPARSTAESAEPKVERDLRAHLSVRRRQSAAR